jgi:hypothetical protein
LVLSQNLLSTAKIVYNLLMPISKFAIQVAHALADYLSEDNTAALPPAYQYGIDNSAVLNPYTATNMSQKAVGLAASAAMRALKYSYSFWGEPAPSPSPLNYNTPAVSNLLSVPGIDGLDRAIHMAKHFGLLEGLNQGESLVEILKSPDTNRRSALVNHGGFHAVDPSNQLKNVIIQSDCEHILGFLTHKDNWYNKTSGRRIISTIQTFFKISADQIENEKKALMRYHDDFEMIDNNHVSLPPSSIPAEFFHPENALLKLIYEKTQALNLSLANEMIHSVSYPSNSHSQHSTVSRQYSSSSARNTSSKPASSSHQSNASSSSSSSRSASNNSPQFKFS